MNEAALAILRIAIGILLTYAAVAKLRSGRGSVARAIAGYRILPTGLALRAAPALIGAELATGVALLVDAAPPWSAIAAVALLTVFTLALVETLVRRRKSDCGCGGVLSGPVRWPLVVRNLALITALAFVVINKL